MKIELIPNWKRVMMRSWTVLTALLAGLLAAAEAMHSDLMALLPVLQPYVEEGTAAIAAAIVTAFAPLARIIKQVSLEVERETKELDSD